MTFKTLYLNSRAFFARDNAAKADVSKITARKLLASFIVLMMTLPGMAMAEPWDDVGNKVLEILTGGLARTIAIIIVAALGISAMAGKMSWGWAANVIIGIVLVFGGAALVDFIISVI